MEKPVVAVERDRNKVTIELTYADIYAAMQSYDEMIAALTKGQMRLDLEVKAPQP